MLVHVQNVGGAWGFKWRSGSCWLSFFFPHVFDSPSSLLSAALAAVSRAVSSYTAHFHPWPTDAGISKHSQMFWGWKIKKCLQASLPVCLRVSLSSGDNHTASLVFLLLISVRRRMVGECQLSLKHLLPANNSLCRCLVLADGSPIVSSLLTQNNNADECQLLVRLFSPPPHCVSSAALLLYAAALAACVAAAELLTAALPDGAPWSGAGGPPRSRPLMGAAASNVRTPVWNVGGVAAKGGEVTSSHTSSLSSSFLNSSAIIPEALSLLCFHSPSPKPA